MRCDKELEKMINNVIENDIFKDFDNERYQVGRDKLQKLYLQYYYNTENMNIKWRVLYNLIYVENILEDVLSVKNHSKILKAEIEKSKEYFNSNKKNYSDLLSYYIPTHDEELSKSEKIELYKFSYDINKKYIKNEKCDRDFFSAIVAKFNLYLALEDEEVILNIINTLSSLHNNEAISLIEDMLKDIQESNMNIYNKAISIKKIIV